MCVCRCVCVGVCVCVCVCVCVRERESVREIEPTSDIQAGQGFCLGWVGMGIWGILEIGI